MACLTLAAHLGPPRRSQSQLATQCGVATSPAAVLIAQVVVGLALLLDGGGLAVAPSVIRAGGAGRLGRPRSVAFELNRIRGEAPHGLEVRLGLSLTPALLDQRLAALAAHLPRAQALRKALAAAVVLRRRVGGERLIARTARGKKAPRAATASGQCRDTRMRLVHS